MKRRNEKGITLIALIITIILMLILAGVVLSLTIGENGLFNIAKYATKKWNNSVEQEQSELDELYAYINGEPLPQNTKDTVAGTLVEVPDEWKTSTPIYVSTPDGKEVVSSKKISTVQAVATGNGETVPVPLGFYYVGGKISTGVVISDRKEDQNKYKNETEIPSGIEAVLNEDGSVKEIKNTLVGNQFVWVPCKEEEYIKTDWGELNGQTNGYYDTSVDIAGKIQTRKYKGFYVGRYEAGLAKDIEENALQTYNREGIPQSKAGVIPWNYIDWSNSRRNAESMYKTNYVDSGLITGTQWDVMVNWVTNKDNSIISSSETFGNYPNVTPNINLGRTSHGGYSSNAWYQDAFTSEWIINTKRTTALASRDGYIWTTGASDETRKKNLYDIAGNLCEWTEEVSFFGGNTNTQARVIRGGCFHQTSSKNPVCNRLSNYTIEDEDLDTGFRVVLYMK